MKKMKKMKPTLLILAAGVGSRYGGLKQIDTLGPTNETIIDYSVYDAYKAGFGKVVFVIRKSIEHDFKEAISDKYSGKIKVDYVLQEIESVPERFSISNRTKPWGTGHAVLMASEVIKEPFAVINGDDFYGADAFKQMSQFLTKNHDGKGKFSMVGYYLQNTLSENGFVSRGVCRVNENGFMTDVQEHTKIQEINGEIVYEDENGFKKQLNPNSIVSMNFWGFTPDLFHYLQNMFEKFLEQNHYSEKAEFYIPYAVNDLVKDGLAEVNVLNTSASWFGVTYREDRSMVISNLRLLHDKGIYPTPLW